MLEETPSGMQTEPVFMEWKVTLLSVHLLLTLAV